MGCFERQAKMPSCYSCDGPPCTVDLDHMGSMYCGIAYLFQALDIRCFMEVRTKGILE